MSIGAALALNLLGIGAFAAATSQWLAPAGTPQRVPWMTVVALSEPVVEAESPQAALPSTAPTAPTTTTRSVATATPTAPPPPPHVEASSPVRFYRSGEVERPAEPDSDWNLDAAALDALGTEVLIFDIFVSRNGEVLGCTVVAPATLADETRDSLERRLRQTIVRAAIRDGMPVASVRRIEVSVLPSEQ